MWTTHSNNNVNTENNWYDTTGKNFNRSVHPNTFSHFSLVASSFRFSFILQAFVITASETDTMKGPAHLQLINIMGKGAPKFFYVYIFTYVKNTVITFGA